MKTIHTDVAVIGAGSAGLGAYHAARKAGATAVLIENGPYGTTCARVGCMPSKLLISAADAAQSAKEAPVFGVHPGSVRIDGREVMQRVRAERDRFVSFVVEDVDSFPAEDKLRGEAHFKSDTVLQVGDHTEVHARAVVIATGSRPAMPEQFKELGDRAVFNDDVFEWETLPRRVVVFGPGVIGLELGQALVRLGVDIRVFGTRGSLAALSDPEVKEEARKILQSELFLDPDGRVLRTERIGDEVEVAYIAADNTEKTERFDYALIATGRDPNVESLKLSNTSLTLDKKGVPTYDRKSMQCGEAPIFIAGDVDGDLPFLHEASDEGRISGQNAATYPKVQCFARRTPLAIVFTDPQIAVAGRRYADVQDEDIVVGSVSFANQGRARVMHQNRGLMRVYAACGEGRLLGAEMACPGAEHLAHLLAWAIQQELTVAQILDLPFYHPVLQEGMRTALRNAVAKLKEVRAKRTPA